MRLIDQILLAAVAATVLGLWLTFLAFALPVLVLVLVLRIAQRYRELVRLEEQAAADEALQVQALLEEDSDGS